MVWNFSTFLVLWGIIVFLDIREEGIADSGDCRWSQWKM